EQRLVLGLCEVERDRFLAAVEPDEMRAFAVHDVVVVAREVAFGPLDLDDARAGVGQAAGALRRGDGLFDRDDEKSGKGKRHLQTREMGLSSRSSKARVGTHTPQSIDMLRRMGPRFRGDNRK